MADIQKATRQVTGYTAENLPAEILQSDRPVILKGLVNHWPVVQAGIASPEKAADYIRSFDAGKPVDAYYGRPEIEGSFFYESDFSKLNFQTRPTPLPEVFAQIFAHKEDKRPPAFYVGTASIDLYLPGFRRQNDIGLQHLKPIVSIWMGNQSCVAAHWDGPANLACSVVGRRRFTLFPPDQIENLYPGPLDFTPAGQAISLVDFKNPDFKRFPRFRDALAAGEIAELEPGDAVLIPNLWWHRVEGLAPFNVLVNYWWRTVPGYTGAGMNALEHALLALRDLPDAEKQAWKHVFDYYIFSPKAKAAGHIPEKVQGVLDMDETRARQLRAKLLQKLNR
jgi:hypothetical protein